jgi:circadian clock protein KaiC
LVTPEFILEVPMPDVISSLNDKAATGIVGFDAFTQGGFAARRIYLLEGDPGVGKTTFALQFLLEGVAKGEKVLLLSLAESIDELASVAESHGWSLKDINIFNLSASETMQEAQYSILQPSEVELGETIEKIVAEVDRLKPSRIVLDSLSEMRLLAQTPLRYRRQILALKKHFIGRNSTVLLLDDRAGESKDLTLQSLVHGVVELQKYSPVYGKARRKLQVVKMRGVDFQAGFHDFSIVKGGIRVYPRLVASDHKTDFKPGRCSSNIAELDEILGGGLDRGTATLIVGPAGSGKSSLAALYAFRAAENGESAAIFTFDEGIETLLTRTRALNIDLAPHIEAGRIHLQQIDPAEMSPGEFMWHVKHVVEDIGAKFVVIDSLTGYLDAMPESEFLTIQMHEMLTYLNHQGVVSILTMAQHGYLGANMSSPADISYLADTVIVLRYFEARGEIKKAISVMKKRSGDHQTAIREYTLGPDRIRVGRELKDFHGILTGTPILSAAPIYEGAAGPGNGSPRR